jgi:HAD superfamily hydrolase (TIGR01509 family)
MPSAVDEDAVAVLFDFDGTLGDTETPAMRVAFWELAPYFPDATAASLTVAARDDYVRANAGKAFEFMVDVVEEDRAKAGLPPIEEARSSAAEKQDVLQVVDKARAESGLPPLAETRKLGKDILTLQKDETVDALATLAVPCPGVPETLAALKANGTPFSIATTSGKPRVPVSVVACKFEEYFPPSAIHSGESDFDPPRFKPDPSVYLLAAKETGALPSRCVAVEDSTSGVGSAANAKVGVIVGYVGGSHVALDAKDAHAATLMSGVKADDGRGADIVISDFTDLLPLVEHFRARTPRRRPRSRRKRWISSRRSTTCRDSVFLRQARKRA